MDIGLFQCNTWTPNQFLSHKKTLHMIYLIWNINLTSRFHLFHIISCWINYGCDFRMLSWLFWLFCKCCDYFTNLVVPPLLLIKCSRVSGQQKKRRYESYALLALSWGEGGIPLKWAIIPNVFPYVHENKWDRRFTTRIWKVIFPAHISKQYLVGNPVTFAR